MRCSNMAEDSKTEKNLGHNLTVTRLVSLPKTHLRTTTGCYIVKYTLRETATEQESLQAAYSFLK